MNLKKLITEKKQDLSIVADFKGVFDIALLYTDRPTLDKMIEASKTRRWVKHQEVEALDDDLFNRQLASRICGWTGLTLGKLAGLINIDIEGENPEAEIPFTKENAEMLMDEVYGLNNFIRETITDLQIFREKKL